MKAFWTFASWMLQYRRLLALGIGAAVIDAACAFGGFGVLLLIVDQFFGRGEASARELFQENLGDSELVNRFIDPAPLIELIPAEPLRGFLLVLGVVLVFSTVGAVMRFSHEYAMMTMALRTTMRIRKVAFHRMLHTPMDLLMHHGSADSLSRIIRDTSKIGRGFHALMGKAVRNVFVGLAMLLLALVLDPWLTAIFMVGAPPLVICIRKFGKRIRRASKYASRAYGTMVRIVQEPMQSLAVVKTHGAEGYERRRFNRINRRVYRQEAKVRLAKALSSPTVELMSIVGVMAVSVIAAWYVFRTDYGNAGDMGKVVLALGMAGASLRPLANLNNKLQEAAAAAERVHELMHLPAEPNIRGQHKLPDNAPPLPRHQRDVRYEHVSFTYPDAHTPALRDIDLHVEFGQTLAVVGPNGSGKTTLLSLLPRLMDPDQGRIVIDDNDIAQFNLRSLRQQIALVSQQVAIFSGTIGENIAYGHRHVSPQRIEQAARAAYAHDFIDTLPNGYDTILGEGGLGLSGGQKQRLAIARAILRDPPILILDEATSQIDAESESLINEALNALRVGRTTFVIAHRLSTVVEADSIVVMDGGRVLDQGKHHELIQRCSLYQRLTHTQLMPAPT